MTEPRGEAHSPDSMFDPSTRRSGRSSRAELCRATRLLMFGHCRPRHRRSLNLRPQRFCRRTIPTSSTASMPAMGFASSGSPLMATPSTYLLVKRLDTHGQWHPWLKTQRAAPPFTLTMRGQLGRHGRFAWLLFSVRGRRRTESPWRYFCTDPSGIIGAPPAAPGT
jgi:hypothetical protein